jgi:hypothetical protein
VERRIWDLRARRRILRDLWVGGSRCGKGGEYVYRCIFDSEDQYK